MDPRDCDTEATSHTGTTNDDDLTTVVQYVIVARRDTSISVSIIIIIDIHHTITESNFIISTIEHGWDQRIRSGGIEKN